MSSGLIKNTILVTLLAYGLTACVGQDTTNSNSVSRSPTRWATKPSAIRYRDTDNLTNTKITKAANWFTDKLISELGRSGDLWDRLPGNFQIPHYEDSPQVQAQIKWFLRHQDYLNRTVRRAAPYMYYIHQQIQRRNLPAELVLLPIIESAYNPFVNSNVGAAGLWQFMPQTASLWGIKRNFWYDGRRDVSVSTNAALDFLTYLQNYFNGNWLLAIAAYNTGEGNVQAAINRNARDGINTEFWALPLAQQTQAYVPRLLALASIIAHRKEYGIILPKIEDKPYLAQVDVGSQIDLAHAAKLASMSLQELHQLNPAYNRGATDPNGPFILLLPIDKIDTFKENLAKFPRIERLTLQPYKIKQGDTLPRIALQFETTIEKIKTLNKLRFSHVKTGKVILIPMTTIAVSHKSRPVNDNLVTALQDDSNISQEDSTHLQSDVVTNRLGNTLSITSALEEPIEPPVSENHSTSSKREAKKTVHYVKAGETLISIAKSYKVTPQQLQEWNHIKKNSHQITAGHSLVIWISTSTKVIAIAHSKKPLDLDNNANGKKSVKHVLKPKNQKTHLSSKTRSQNTLTHKALAPSQSSAPLPRKRKSIA